MPVTFPGDPLDMELEKAIHIFSNGEPVGATIRVLQTYSNIIHIFFSQFEINSNDLVVNRYNFMMTHHHLPSFPTSHPGCGKPTKNVGHFPRGKLHLRSSRPGAQRLCLLVEKNHGIIFS